MPKKLKPFVTEAGFYELAVAAPSMQAALRAWGMTHDAFRMGLARQSDDPAIAAAAAAAPGVVLRRPIGSKGAFKQQAELPRVKSRRKKSVATAAPKPDKAKIRAAQRALDKAAGQHRARAEALRADADAIQDRIAREDEAWARSREKLEDAVRRARIRR